MSIINKISGVSDLTDDDRDIIDGFAKIPSFDIVGNGTLTIKNSDDIVDIDDVKKIHDALFGVN